VFHPVFADQLDEGDLDEEICLSLLNYHQGKAASNPQILSADLSETFFLGLGAVCCRERRPIEGEVVAPQEVLTPGTVVRHRPDLC
jgi:hypothetical protein